MNDIQQKSLCGCPPVYERQHDAEDENEVIELMEAIKLARPTFSKLNPPLSPLPPEQDPRQLPEMGKQWHGKDWVIDYEFDLTPVPQRWDLTLVGYLGGQEVDAIALLGGGLVRASFRIGGEHTAVGGSHEITYALRCKGTEVRSESLRFRVRTLAPNKNKPGSKVALPPEVVEHGLTQEYLDKHGQVEITVPSYAGLQLCDVARVSLVAGDTLTVLIGTCVRRALSDTLIVYLKAEHIGDIRGTCRIFYELATRSGNWGPPSLEQLINIKLPVVAK
ncbi:TPA: hypothetical protein QEM96_004652 [Pseudomonas putida]|nr:hypothetical protein [Pseudomonas putida]